MILLLKSLKINTMKTQLPSDQTLTWKEKLLIYGTFGVGVAMFIAASIIW